MHKWSIVTLSKNDAKNSENSVSNLFAYHFHISQDCTINENFRGWENTERENCDRNPDGEANLPVLCICMRRTLCLEITLHELHDH